MKKNRSKSIGNEYERELSRKLSLWFTNGESDDVCWRDLGSGNRSSIRQKQGKKSLRDGDIVATDLRYKKFFDTFHIDSKSLGSVHLMLINPLSKKSSQLLNEWNKVCGDAEKFNKLPLMFVKARNDRKIPDFVLCSLLYFECNSYIKFSDFKKEKDSSFFLILQDDFFKNNNWEELIKNNKLWKYIKEN